MPNGVGTAQVPYGIVQTPIARHSLDALAIADMVEIRRRIDSLSDDPRPDGYEPADLFGKGLTSITVVNPPYIIVYMVDDEQHRVIVVAISEKRW